MKYVNAEKLLPSSLVEELQTYMQGGYLYIPTVPKKAKRWGEASGSRRELQERNRRIAAEYRSGVPAEALAGKYFLSVHAIRKIIYRK